MERGLYIAASGMLAEQARQDLIANDLANASTPGYKADRVSQRSFDQMLLANTAGGGAVGTLGTGVGLQRTATDMTQGALRATGEPLDFAIEGEGFFAVRTDEGVRYTRNGQFAASAAGTLVTAQGAEVLGPSGAAVRVGADGTVAPTAIGVVGLTDPRKAGDSLLTGTPGGRAAGVVRGGTLEGSAADPTSSMVNMIGSLRAFESGQRVITTIDETLRKAANDVGTIGR